MLKENPYATNKNYKQTGTASGLQENPYTANPVVSPQIAPPVAQPPQKGFLSSMVDVAKHPVNAIKGFYKSTIEDPLSNAIYQNYIAPTQVSQQANQVGQTAVKENKAIQDARKSGMKGLELKNFIKKQHSTDVAMAGLDQTKKELGNTKQILANSILLGTTFGAPIAGGIEKMVAGAGAKETALLAAKYDAAAMAKRGILAKLGYKTLAALPAAATGGGVFNAATTAQQAGSTATDIAKSGAVGMAVGSAFAPAGAVASEVGGKILSKFKPKIAESLPAEVAKPTGSIPEPSTIAPKEVSKVEAYVNAKSNKFREAPATNAEPLIHAKDLQLMEHYAQYAKNPNAFDPNMDIAARQMAEHYGIDPHQTNPELGKSFETVLQKEADKVKFAGVNFNHYQENGPPLNVNYNNYQDNNIPLPPGVKFNNYQEAKPTVVGATGIKYLRDTSGKYAGSESGKLPPAVGGETKPKSKDQSAEKFRVKEPMTAEDLKLYHGTNEEFNKFVSDKYGNGSGGDLWGKGTYLTDSEEVAKGYAKSVGGETKGNRVLISASVKKDLNFFEPYDKKSFGDFIIKFADQIKSKEPYMYDELKSSAYKKDFEGMAKDYWINQKGGEYKTNEDKINALQSFTRFIKVRINDTIIPHNGMTPGERIHLQDQDFTKYLKDSGFDGVKYDAGKISDVPAPKGSSNYVIFEPDKINVTGADRFRLKDDFEKFGLNITDAQEKKIEELNKKYLGDHVDVKIMGQILTPKGQEALGSYRDGMIKILGGQADAVDSYMHETVHAYIDLFTTKNEQIALLTAAQKHYGIEDIGQVEEKLAEDFINYAKTHEGVIGTIQAHFDNILQNIRRYFGAEDQIKSLYSDITTGKANKQLGEVKNYQEMVSLVTEALNSGDKAAAKSIYDSIPKTDYLPKYEDIVKNNAQQNLSAGLEQQMAGQAAKHEAMTAERASMDQILGAENVDNVKKILKSKLAQDPNFDVSKIKGFDELAQMVRDAKGQADMTDGEVLSMIEALPTSAEINAAKPIEIAHPKPLEVIQPAQVDQIATANVAGGETVKVPKTQLPVGEGDVKVSRLAARMEGVLKNTSKEDIQRLGLPTYNAMNNKEQIRMAADYVVKNPEDAMRVLKGEIEPPTGVKSNSVFVAMAQQAADDSTGRLARDLATLRASSYGQEIEILKELDKNNPVKIIDDLKKYNIEALGKGKDKMATGQKVVDQMVTREKTKLVSLAKSENIKGSSQWSKLLESIQCP